MSLVGSGIDGSNVNCKASVVTFISVVSVYALCCCGLVCFLNLRHYLISIHHIWNSIHAKSVRKTQKETSGKASIISCVSCNIISAVIRRVFESAYERRVCRQQEQYLHSDGPATAWYDFSKQPLY